MPCRLNDVSSNKTIPRGGNRGVLCVEITSGRGGKGRRQRGSREEEDRSVLLIGLLFTPETEGLGGKA